PSGRAHALPSGRREHRQRWAVAFGRLEHDFHRLLALQLVEVAVDDVGHHARTLRQRDVGHGVRHRRTAHHTVGVDRTLARGLDPFRLVAEAERTDRARIVVQLAAARALAYQQLALGGGVP